MTGLVLSKLPIIRLVRELNSNAGWLGLLVGVDDNNFDSETRIGVRGFPVDRRGHGNDGVLRHLTLALLI